MDSDPKKRPIARHINDRLDITASTMETSISSSSVEQQVSFLKEQYCQEEIAELSSGYLGKDIKEHAETKEFAEYVESPREHLWQQGQQEAYDDQCSLWAAQDREQNDSLQGASISSSNSSMLYKLKNLDILGRKARRKFYEMHGGPILEKANCLKLFKRWELKPILMDQNLVGKGSSEEIYKGLVNGILVVVKKLNSGTAVLNEQFANEAIIQSQIVRKNIVKLIGCCLEGNPMLVYEFISQGSLHEILHNSNQVALNLTNRLYIALGSADGIAYIHSACYEPILHGKIKPSNILLDDNFVPKISDAGISRLIARDYERSGLTIGDMAYTDPIYIRTGLLTEKSDVYSFGVVMLELLARKKATHANNNSLVMDFLENHKQGRKSTELFDKEIAVARDLELLDNLAGIAMECLNLDVDERPTMTDVADRLLTLYHSRQNVESTF